MLTAIGQLRTLIFKPNIVIANDTAVRVLELGIDMFEKFGFGNALLTCLLRSDASNQHSFGLRQKIKRRLRVNHQWLPDDLGVFVGTNAGKLRGVIKRIESF